MSPHFHVLKQAEAQDCRVGVRTKHGPGVHGPPLWTGSMDHFHGPGPWTPCHGPGPWTVFLIMRNEQKQK